MSKLNALAIARIAALSALALGCDRASVRIDETFAVCGERSESLADHLLVLPKIPVPPSTTEDPIEVVGIPSKTWRPSSVSSGWKVTRGCLFVRKAFRGSLLVSARRDASEFGAAITFDGQPRSGEEVIRPVALMPIRSRATFESCGVADPGKRKLVVIRSSAGRPVSSVDLRVRPLASSAARGRLPSLSAFGCLPEDSDDVVVSESEGGSAVFIGPEEKMSGRAFLLDGVDPDALSTCAVNPDEPTRNLLRKGQVDLWELLESARRAHGAGGTRVEPRFSSCSSQSECPAARWIPVGTDPTGLAVSPVRLGRCVMVRSGTRLLLRSEWNDDQGNSDPSALIAAVGGVGKGSSGSAIAAGRVGVTVPSWTRIVPAGALARELAIALPQCRNGRLPFTHGSEVVVDVSTREPGRLASVARIEIHRPTAEAPLLVADRNMVVTDGNRARIVRAIPPGILTREEEGPLLARIVDLQGGVASYDLSPRCRLESVGSEALPKPSNGKDHRTTFDTGTFLRLAEEFPAAPSTAFSYRLVGTSQDGTSARDSSARRVFWTQEDCLRADGFEPSVGGLVPFTHPGIFVLDVRACSDAGEERRLPSWKVHLDSTKPTFRIAGDVRGDFLGTIEWYGQVFYVKVSEFEDDVVRVADALAASQCDVRVSDGAESRGLTSRCTVIEADDESRTGIIKVEWEDPLGAVAFLRQRESDRRYMRVNVSVPTMDERDPSRSSAVLVPLAPGLRGRTRVLGTFKGDMEIYGTSSAIASGKDLSGALLVMTERYQILRLDPATSEWSWVADSRVSHPGKPEKDPTTDLPGADWDVRGNLDAPSPYWEEDARGLVYEVSKGEFLFLDGHVYDSNDDDSEGYRHFESTADTSLGFYYALAPFRSLCRDGKCESPMPLRGGKRDFDTVISGRRWFVQQGTRLRIGTLGQDGAEEFVLPAGVTIRQSKDESAFIDPWNRIWVRAPGGAAKVFLPSKGVFEKPSALYAELTEREKGVRTSLSFSEPGSEGARRAALVVGRDVCVLEEATATCREILEEGDAVAAGFLDRGELHLFVTPGDLRGARIVTVSLDSVRSIAGALSKQCWKGGTAFRVEFGAVEFAVDRGCFESAAELGADPWASYDFATGTLSILWNDPLLHTNTLRSRERFGGVPVVIRGWGPARVFDSRPSYSVGRGRTTRHDFVDTSLGNKRAIWTEDLPSRFTDAFDRFCYDKGLLQREEWVACVQAVAGSLEGVPARVLESIEEEDRDLARVVTRLRSTGAPAFVANNSQSGEKHPSGLQGLFVSENAAWWRADDGVVLQGRLDDGGRTVTVHRDCVREGVPAWCEWPLPRQVGPDRGAAKAFAFLARIDGEWRFLETELPKGPMGDLEDVSLFNSRSDEFVFRASFDRKSRRLSVALVSATQEHHRVFRVPAALDGTIAALTHWLELPLDRGFLGCWQGRGRGCPTAHPTLQGRGDEYMLLPHASWPATEDWTTKVDLQCVDCKR